MLSTYRLEVVNYFDNLCNDLDVKAETFLSDQSLSIVIKERLDETRTIFINKIKQIEIFNLNRLQTLDPSQIKLVGDDLRFALFKNFCFFIDPVLVNIDSELLEEKSLGLNLGYLVVIDKYLTKRQLDCYNEILKFHDSSQILHFLNDFFAIKYNPVRFITFYIIQKFNEM
jgi:hypothetical protein